MKCCRAGYERISLLVESVSESFHYRHPVIDRSSSKKSINVGGAALKVVFIANDMRGSEKSLLMLHVNCEAGDIFISLRTK